jgi:hypothetical protein
MTIILWDTGIILKWIHLRSGQYLTLSCVAGRMVGEWWIGRDIGGSDHALVEVLSLHLTIRNESNSKFWVTANRLHKKYRSIVCCLTHLHVVKARTEFVWFRGGQWRCFGRGYDLSWGGLNNWKAISSSTHLRKTLRYSAKWVGWTILGSNPVWGTRFISSAKRTDRVWRPSSLFSMGTGGSFPGSRAKGR